MTDDSSWGIAPAHRTHNVDNTTDTNKQTSIGGGYRGGA